AIKPGMPTHVSPIHSAPTDIIPGGVSRKARGQKLFLVLGALILLASGLFAVWLAWKGNLGSQGGAGDGANIPSLPALTATAPGVTSTDITLGLSAPFSGPAKELGHGM